MNSGSSSFGRVSFGTPCTLWYKSRVQGSFLWILSAIPITGAPVTCHAIGKSTLYPSILLNLAYTSGTVYVRPCPICIAPLGYGKATVRNSFSRSSGFDSNSFASAHFFCHFFSIFSLTKSPFIRLFFEGFQELRFCACS